MKNTLPSHLRGALFLGAASLAATLAAQTPETTAAVATATTTVTTAPSLSHYDNVFFVKAAAGGAKEVAVSQAVMGKLTNPQVRAYATAMVTDHNAANNEILNLALRKGVTLPAQDATKITEKWSEKDGNVDKKYLHEMIEDHEDAVKLFEKASKSDDADIAAFAQKTLPTLQHHLQMAKDLKKSL